VVGDFGLKMPVYLMRIIANVGPIQSIKHVKHALMEIVMEIVMEWNMNRNIYILGCSGNVIIQILIMMNILPLLMRRLMICVLIALFGLERINNNY
jgi:hypothetical protein